MTAVRDRALLLWRRSVVFGRRGARATTLAWRRSLQFRIVSITLVVSTMLVVIFGYLVAQQITAGLVVAKRKAAVEQVNLGREDAQAQIAALSGPNDPDLRSTIHDVVRRLASVPGRAGTFEVLLTPTGTTSVTPVSLPHTANKLAVPAQLRRKLSADQVIAYQFSRANPDERGARPFLVVGAPVTVGWGRFALYYLFPLDEESSAANLVRTTLLVTGSALVLLLAFMAGIVTRLVVNPVRDASRTAQLLSAGQLGERMIVRGEDDLARLAASFNQMAENLQRQIVRLEDMSRLQRRFTSDVSHELRTPLTTVRMAADLIYSSRKDFPPEVARSAELLEAELDRFESLLADLLEISRYDAGVNALEAEPVEVAPLVAQVANALRPLADRWQTTIEIDVPDSSIFAEVDPRRVERILRNLLGNAIEHSEHQPVHVTMAANETAVAIAVRDHGVGLQPGEEQLVFNRFWRADPSRARQTGGTGLGLSISLEDARLHDGWLEAWGEPERGAVFRLTLPLRSGTPIVSSPLPLAPAEVTT